MRIHYYMQFFPGADSPGSRQPISLVRALAKRGHEVTVLGTDYNLITREDEQSTHEVFPEGGSLHILRVPSPRGGRGTNRQRLESYLTFAARAFAQGMRLPKPDVILGSIQPMFTGAAALGVAKARRVPFMLEVRDLWPDALVVKGALSKNMAMPLYGLAYSLYQMAERVVSLTPGIKTELLRKGIAPQKIDVMPNGFDPELFKLERVPRDEIRKKYGWGDDLVAIYTGSFTQVTACEVYVRAAARLKDRKGVRFDMFGDGPTLPEVKKLAEDLGADNVHFHAPVPKKEIPGILEAADLALMALFVSPLVHIYFENKFMDYMGAGKPILAAMGGEQADIIRRFDTGRVVEAFDDEGLARLVLDAAEDPNSFAEMGERGRALVKEHLLLPGILERYAQRVEAVAERRAGELEAWEPLR